MKNCLLKCGSVFFLSLVTSLLLLSCSEKKAMRDGYYTAEALEFDAHGWKEFVTIYVNNGRIVTVEYNAKNESGFIKSWDPDYVRKMNAANGTYPDEYTRIYADALLQSQNPGEVDVLTGATESWHSFKQLAEGVIGQALRGEKEVAFVHIDGEAP
jgi:major membrane immunogen (membrane-anchored lipoprotein)